MDSFQVAYKVLEADLLRQTDKERAVSVALLVTSDEEARKLAGHDGFGYRMIDTVNGRAGVVTFRGAEIVLLFKRKIVEQVVGHADPMPERALQEPSDAWIRVNLLDPKVPYFASSHIHKLQSEVDRLRLLLKAKNVDLGGVQKELETEKPQREEIKRLNTKVTNLENIRKALEKDLDDKDLKLRTGKQESDNKLSDLALEVLPAYDTVRISLEVDPNNKLMSGLQGQLKATLRNFGCDLIEPLTGILFNPELHHAVHVYPLPLGDPRIGKVLKVSTVGLKKGGKILKAAYVAVGIEKTESASA